MEVDDILEIQANDLYYTDYHRRLELEDYYRNILKEILQKITLNYKNKRNITYYNIPEVKPSIPDYNLTDAVLYLITALRKKRFYVRYSYPNLLIINSKDLDAQRDQLNKQKYLLYEHMKTEQLLKKNGHLNPVVEYNKEKNTDEYDPKDISSVTMFIQLYNTENDNNDNNDIKRIKYEQ